MQYREFAAPASLDQLVHCVWLLQGPAAGNAPQPIVPDGRFELVAHLGEPFSRLERSGAATRQQSLLVSGQLTRPLTLVPTGNADVVGVRLHPLGAYAILGIPLDEIADQVLPMREINGRLADALLPAMASKGAPEEHDQPHLIRDFRRFAGASPRAFFLSNPSLAQAFTSGASSY